MAALETSADMLAEEAVEGFSSATAKRAARNATALALSNIASKGLLFIWQLMLARWLEASDYGVYGTIDSSASIGAAFPEFGMGLIVVRDIADRPRDAGPYLSATLTLQPLFAAAGYIVLTVLAVLLLAGTVLVLRETHPPLAAVDGVPVSLIAVLVVGVIGKDDWDLIYRLAIAMPGGTVIARYWKRQLA
jgi:O-antigen/teichoic acid export membrane protein